MKPFRLTSPTAPAPASANTLRGQNAQKAGSDFEKAITFSAGLHKTVVALERLPSFGAKRIAGGVIVPTPICADYIGAFVNGPGLFFDAKSTDDPTSLSVKGAIMSKPHQLAFLRRMFEAGQVAGYLVECKALSLYLWLDVLYVVDDGPIRFARNGALCRQWFRLGPTTLAVNFKALYDLYVEPEIVEKP